MKLKYIVFTGIFMAIGCVSDNSNALVDPPLPYGAIPTENQVKWNQLEYYAFAHFGINTFTDKEWGYGNDSIQLFNPTNFDAEQWAQVVKKAGMKGIILTAKHHDGFCLWPSKYTEYSVKNTPYKNGKGDIVREVSDACRKYGLKFGVYISPWDRNHADYGKESYVEYFHNQIRELLTNYGEIFEVWFDGANGGDGYYGGANEVRKIDSKTYYRWDKVKQIVRELQPNAIIWGDAIDARWVGNEKGFASETNWSTINIDSIIPGGNNKKYLISGVMNGKDWSAAEADVSTRPGWFYSSHQDDRVKTLSQLSDIYYKTVGRNCNLLLNIPIDRQGLIHPNDEKQLLRLAEKLKEDFAAPIIHHNNVIRASSVRNNDKAYAADKVIDSQLETYWTPKKGEHSGSIEVNLGLPTKFNRFLVQENIRLGQRVKSFQLEAYHSGQWNLVAEGTTIGYKRILRFNPITASKIRFTVKDALAEPAISTLQLYDAPLLLSNPSISRDSKAMVHLISSDVGVNLFYSTNDTDKISDFTPYSKPFAMYNQGIVRVVARNNQWTSDIISEQLEHSKARFSIEEKDSNPQLKYVIDENPNTWGATLARQKPEFVIDLGETFSLKGFSYTPPTEGKVFGIIQRYEFWVSHDGVQWKKALTGEFSNLENNPQRTEVLLPQPTTARFIKLKALKLFDDGKRASAAEIGILL